MMDSDDVLDTFDWVLPKALDQQSTRVGLEIGCTCDVMPACVLLSINPPVGRLGMK